jgi:hypothetical protein
MLLCHLDPPNTIYTYLSQALLFRLICHTPTVHLTSIYHPQIEGKITKTPAWATKFFLVARTSLWSELVLASKKYVMAPLEVGPEFAFN